MTEGHDKMQAIVINTQEQLLIFQTLLFFRDSVNLTKTY